MNRHGRHGTRRAASIAGLVLSLALVSAVAPRPLAGQARNALSAARDGEMIGSVIIPRNVLASGKPLKAGSYGVRLEPDNTAQAPPGDDDALERWVEFMRGGKVLGREVVHIVPQSEIAEVAQDTPPRPGASSVQLLEGNAYLRVWMHRGGLHYLIHLQTGSPEG